MRISFKHIGFAVFYTFPVYLAAQVPDTTLQYLQSIDYKIREHNKSNQFQSVANSKDTTVVTFPDIYYEFKIEKLDKQSPIKLDFNQDVLKYINIYLQKRPEKVSTYLGLKDLYFPVFEECLAKYNLPLELKYLPVIESGLDPQAVSRSGAVGLWQLLYNSSKLLGLEIDSYKDERRDLYLSTDAACRYLKYLYSVFNDWRLALGAYNGGPGEIRNAIIRSGGKTNFWEIQPYLAEQTRWYVPAFIAAVYVMNHAADHNIKPKAPLFSFNNIDTLMIIEAAEFSKISERTGVPVEKLQFLNPCYIRDYIPDTEKPQALVLPSDKILTFLKLENQIYSRTNDTADYFDVVNKSNDTTGLKKTFYIVSQGDFLHKIALKYECSIENLKKWNNLKKDNLETGQKLVVWIKKDSGSANIDSSTKAASKQKIFYYTVKRGDTIWGIAAKFKCDSVKTIKEANNIANDHDLKAGQQLKIVVNVE